MLCVQYDIKLGDMALGQRHDTPLGHGQRDSYLSGIGAASIALIYDYAKMFNIKKL